MPRPRLPGDLAEPGERLLAWAEGSGGVVYASTRAIYLPEAGAFGAQGWTRLPWTAVDRASWEEPEVVVEARVDDSARRWRVDLAAPGRIPEVVRERVMASIVVSEHLELREGAGARIVGRRSDVDAPIEWQITFDPGVDPEDPYLREAAVGALAELRDSLGI